MADERVTVLIIDDHPMVAEGMRRVLDRETDIDVIGVAADGDQGIALAAQHRPSVAVIDSNLPGRSGAETAREIRDRNPAVAVLFLSGDGSDSAVLAAVEAGATAYLVKTVSAKEVVETVRRVAGGEMLIPARVLAELIASRRSQLVEEDERRRFAAQFTERELDVIRLIGRGLDNQRMADALNVAPTTMRWHVRNVLEKLQVHSKLEAVVVATEMGLLESPQN